jgi:hypothetical protein
MATRSEQQHAEEQRRGPRDTKKNKKANRSKPGSAPKDRKRGKTRAGGKATHALEPKRAGRPSRESTRKSANRAKGDSSLNHTEEMKKGSPDSRFRKASAGKSRVRGKPRGKNAGA